MCSQSLKNVIRVAAASVVALLAIPHTVHACGNVYYVTTNVTVREAKESSRKLEAGDTRGAAKLVLTAYPDLLARSAAPWLKPKYRRVFVPKQTLSSKIVDRDSLGYTVLEVVRSQPLPGAMARAERTLALAVLRSDGAALGKHLASFISRKHAFYWALAVLQMGPRTELTNDTGIARWQTAAAESGLWIAERAGPALADLDESAAASVLGDPFAWAALSSARRAAGRTDAKAALAECEMTVAKPGACGKYAALVSRRQRSIALVKVQSAVGQP